MAPLPLPTSEPSSDPRSEAAPAAPAAAPPMSQPTDTAAQPTAAPIPQASAAAWADPNAALPMYAQPQPFSPYASYPGAYGSAYSQYGAPSYGASYGAPYGSYQSSYMYPGLSRHTAATGGALAGTMSGAHAMTGMGGAAVPPGGAPSAREAGAVVLNGMQEAMSRFARVSALLEDVLRHLHMLFDAVFGLGYSIGVFRQEAGLWFAIKTGPVGFAVRALRRVATVWRLLCLFFMSPLAGRFSPVALVLRILGLVPDDSEFELSVADLFNRVTATPDEAPSAGLPGLASNSIASAPDASHM